METRLTRTGQRLTGLAMLVAVSAVIGTIVVVAARPHTQAAPPPAAPVAPVTTPLPTKYVVLTFDDGPDPAYTPKVLEVLAKYDVKATFFEVGKNVARHPELTKRIHAAGHTIQNHTWNHADLRHQTAAGFRKQVGDTDQAIRSAAGVTPTCLRPPYGGVSTTVRQRAKALGKELVLWTIDSRDWSKPGPAVIEKRVLGGVKSGSVILMHDGGGNRSQTIAALPGILEKLKAQGYGFRTLSC
ncbi:polysaccharide deacetylase family protein [Kribbella sp. NPDC056951]|uniref:polysaccharide deacetylase family protein n=1 Tax=Kribbella sp. NPDC056951 TaxID=3345978 RepID=UPI00363E938C